MIVKFEGTFGAVDKSSFRVFILTQSIDGAKENPVERWAGTNFILIGDCFVCHPNGDEYWSITHIPTGLRIPTPKDKVFSRNEAILAALELWDLPMGDMWLEDDLAAMKDIMQDYQKEIVEIIKSHVRNGESEAD